MTFELRIHKEVSNLKQETLSKLWHCFSWDILSNWYSQKESQLRVNWEHSETMWSHYDAKFVLVQLPLEFFYGIYFLSELQSMISCHRIYKTSTTSTETAMLRLDINSVLSSQNLVSFCNLLGWLPYYSTLKTENYEYFETGTKQSQLWDRIWVSNLVSKVSWIPIYFEMKNSLRVETKSCDLSQRQYLVSARQSVCHFRGFNILANGLKPTDAFVIVGDLGVKYYRKW